MEEHLLQEWSEALAELREKRADGVEEIQKQKPELSPSDFFDVAAPSLDAVLDRWLQFERRSPSPSVDALRVELDSVHEFELDAISRDLSALREARHWDPSAVAAAEIPFRVTADQLKQKYLLKISSPAGAETALARGAKKKAAEPAPARYGGSSSRGSGAGMALMFFVGLALGAGPSFYFWDLSKKQGSQAEADKAKLAADKRALEDSMALIHGRFDQLASGELKSLPEIEKMEEKIRKEADDKRKAVEDAYTKEKERLTKRIPAGDRLDQALAANEEKRNASLAEIEAASAQAVEPFEKQKATLQEIRAR